MHAMPRHDPLTSRGADSRSVPPFETPEQEIAVLREVLAGAERIMKAIAAERDGLRDQLFELGIQPRSNRRRRPPTAGLPVPAVTPRGPLPKQGGAEAPLEFGED